jgi:hypothetical protein
MSTSASASAGGTTDSFTKEQMLEVSSLMHNELQCVTVQRIAQTLGLSRTRASELLRQVAVSNSECDDNRKSYEATLCRVTEETLILAGEPDTKRTGKYNTMYACTTAVECMYVMEEGH